MSGGEILTRIRAEKVNPKLSVWYGGPADTFIQAMGEGLEKEAMAYLKKLDGQVKQYPKTGSAPAQMAGMGEAMVGISFLHDGIKY